MKNTYKVEFSDEAVLGFENIVHYIESNFSFKDAQKFVVQFDEIIQLIATNPRAFITVSQLRNVRRALVAKLTSVYFSTDEDSKTVYVYYVKDNRQQQPNFL